MLTKKDYKKVAEILGRFSVYIEKTEKETALNLLISDFVEWFKSENPNLDEQKFREAVLK